MSKLVLGNESTIVRDTKLGTALVPTNISPVFIGNTATSADAITIDSGSNFPPGIAFRRYDGDPASPVAPAPGAQSGYCDYRFYSGSVFWNCASIDAVQDASYGYVSGHLPPAKLRFATASDDSGAKVQMEIRPNGAVEIGAIIGSSYYAPTWSQNFRCLVNTTVNDYAQVVTANAAAGRNMAGRFHTKTTAVSDEILSLSSGDGDDAVRFLVKGNGQVAIGAVNTASPFSIEQRLFVNTLTNDWGVAICASAPAGANYAARFHTLSATASDYILAASSGASAGAIQFAVKGNGVVDSRSGYWVDGNKVVGSQGAALPQAATDLASAITLLNAMRDRMLTHGLVASQ